MMEKLGLKEGKSSTFKYTAINKKLKNNISIHDSLHSNGVQRSSYLQIDDDMMYNIHLNPGKLIKMNQNMREKKLAPGKVHS